MVTVFRLFVCVLLRFASLVPFCPFWCWAVNRLDMQRLLVGSLLPLSFLQLLCCSAVLGSRSLEGFSSLCSHPHVGCGWFYLLVLGGSLGGCFLGFLIYTVEVSPIGDPHIYSTLYLSLFRPSLWFLFTF